MSIGTKLILEFMGDSDLPGTRARVCDPIGAALFHPKIIELGKSQKSVTVGSSRSADYQIITCSNFKIAGVHAIIKVIHNKYVISDESVYGTYVDYKRIERSAELKADEIVCFGHPNGNSIEPGALVSPYKHDLKYKVKIIREEPSQAEEGTGGVGNEAVDAPVEPQPRDFLHLSSETDLPEVDPLRFDQIEDSRSQLFSKIQSNSESNSLSVAEYQSGIAIGQKERESQNATVYLEGPIKIAPSSSSPKKQDPRFSNSFQTNSSKDTKLDEQNIIEDSEIATKEERSEAETIFYEDDSEAAKPKVGDNLAPLTPPKSITEKSLISVLSTPLKKNERDLDQMPSDSNLAKKTLTRNQKKQFSSDWTRSSAKFIIETPRESSVLEISLLSDELDLDFSGNLQAAKHKSSGLHNTPPLGVMPNLTSADQNTKSSSKSEKKPQNSAPDVSKENITETYGSSYSNRTSQSIRSESRGIKRFRESLESTPPPIKVRKLDSLKIGEKEPLVDALTPTQEIIESIENDSNLLLQGFTMSDGQQTTDGDLGSSSGRKRPPRRNNSRAKRTCDSTVNRLSIKNSATNSASKSKNPVRGDNHRRTTGRLPKKRESTKDRSTFENILLPHPQNPPEGLYGYFDCCDHSRCKRPVELDGLIQCSTCQKWFHHLCVNLKKHESEDTNYDCPSCRNEKAMRPDDEN